MASGDQGTWPAVVTCGTASHAAPSALIAPAVASSLAGKGDALGFQIAFDRPGVEGFPERAAFGPAPAPA